MANLGNAVLRNLALGIKDVQNFDIIDAPPAEVIETTFRSLIQLGAITQTDDGYNITAEGGILLKLGIEPRLGKMLLTCFRDGLGREGVALATVMASSSSIFCRVGTKVEKLQSDRRKIRFCHPSGDPFTLLSVYKEWDDMTMAGFTPEMKKRWCSDNSINAKTMRACQETLKGLEACLWKELRIHIPSRWRWIPQMHSPHEKTLQRIILSTHVENVAMYSGYDQLGYQVALTGKYIQLHPSCSLLNFCQRPIWVVLSEISVEAKEEYLVCATAFDLTSLIALSPPPPFDFLEMDARKLEKKVLTGFGSMLLKRFCGKSNSHLNHLVSRIRTSFMDERIGIEVDVDHNEIILYASPGDMEDVLKDINQVLELEQKLLKNECVEKFTHEGGSASFVLFGAGAEIRHLELDMRCLTVDIYHSNLNAVDDKKLLMFLEEHLGDIGVVHKFSGSCQGREELTKWGRVTFISPEAASLATDLNKVSFNDGFLHLFPSKINYGRDQKIFSSPLLEATICWPRRRGKGSAIVECNPGDVPFILDDFSPDLIIGGRYVRCEPSEKFSDSIYISSLDKDDSESQIFAELSVLTPREILGVFLFREKAIEHPSLLALEEALLREISSLMPKRAPTLGVQVFQPEPNHTHMRATITFYGNLHLEAAKLLEQMDDKVLPGCEPWQKIKCQRLFQTSLSCSAPVYDVIWKQLYALLARFRNRKGVEYCNLELNQANLSYTVKICANATKIVAEVREAFEEVMKGKVIKHEGVTPTVLQHLSSCKGIRLMRSIEEDTRTYILFDKQSLSVRIFGDPPHRVDMACQKFVESLLALHESKQLVVHLRGETLPPDLMKRVVQTYGPDLNGLKEMFPDGDFSLNIRRHRIHINGSSKDLKQRVEDAIYDETCGGTINIQRKVNCPICLCQVQDGYKLETCLHQICRSCLVEQCESAIRSRDGFPLCCLHECCGTPFVIADLKSLLTVDKLEELFRASLSAYVAGNPCYRFCPSPDCPSIYRVTTYNSAAAFVCGACYAETCTGCHQEYHAYLSCDKYREFKDDPDLSLKCCIMQVKELPFCSTSTCSRTNIKEWSDGRENVKNCPVCKCTIEKVDGCNHMECRCGIHVCWVCLEVFESSDDCYNHLRSLHLSIG